MIKNSENKFFLLIRPKLIEFTVLNKKNKILFDKNLITQDSNLNEIYTSLTKFLEENIINLEKKFNFYIEDISLIIDCDEFILINISTIHNFDYLTNQEINSSNSLVNIKDSVNENMYNHDLIHMIINKFIIDGKDSLSIPDEKNYENLLVEIRFIFLKTNIIKAFKNMFSKYEISIAKIFNYDYVCKFKKDKQDNLFELASGLKNGLNQREILFEKKPQRSVGFFEKFFNFFK